MATMTGAQVLTTILEQAGIRPVGRYARWRFQGIADSLAEGLAAGATAGAHR